MMQITLQSSVGNFDGGFLKALPLLEEEMTQRGLDPSAFIIAKNAAQFPVPYMNLVPEIGRHFDYTVFVAGESFTVTRPGDMDFLDYFRQCCLVPDEPEDAKQEPLIDRLKRWFMDKPQFLK